jgi:hypothetical protein
VSENFCHSNSPSSHEKRNNLPPVLLVCYVALQQCIGIVLNVTRPSVLSSSTRIITDKNLEHKMREIAPGDHDGD